MAPNDRNAGWLSAILTNRRSVASTVWVLSWLGVLVDDGSQIFEEEVWGVGEEVVAGRDAGMDGDGADAVPLGGDDIAGRVAYQGDGGVAGDPAVRAGVADGEAGQPGAVLGHLAEGSKAEVLLHPSAVELLPSDAGEVAGDQSEQHAAVLQAAQEGAHAGAGLALQTWDAVHVDLLRAADDLRHGTANGGRGRAGVAEHAREDVGIEHAVDGDVVSRGFEAGDAADGIDERLAMVGAGAAEEGAGDIEEDEGGGGWHGFGGWHFMMAKRGCAAQGGWCRGAKGAIAPLHVWPGVRPCVSRGVDPCYSPVGG